MALGFYGLLVAPLDTDRSVNLSGAGSLLDAYLRCAAVCHASFAYHGYDWSLVTDAPGLIEEGFARLGLGVPPIVAAEFAWRVPADLRFRAAHHKLELLAQFGSGTLGERAALVDLDAVCLARLPDAITQAAGVVGYDMSALIAGGPDAPAKRASLALLDVETDRPRWWGGEFLLGADQAFAALAERLATLWPRYLDQTGSMAHVGDEMILTAALLQLEAAGFPVADAGVAGAIARFWSARTMAPYPSFTEAQHASILHLPADKPFLAGWAGRPFDPEGFVSDYRRYLKRKIALRRPAALVAGLSGGARRYAPRL